LEVFGGRSAAIESLVQRAFRRRRDRLGLDQRIDVVAIAGLGGYAAGRCVRMIQEAFCLEAFHRVSDGRWRDAQVVRHADILRADRLCPHDVALHHEFEDPAMPLVQVGPNHRSGWLALADVKC